jgi:dienelactone hydrolase
MRASNYFRTAEFLLPPDDPKRPATFEQSTSTFYAGLSALAVPHEVIAVPYGDASLKAVYYPAGDAAPQRPLIVFFGGYDSTLEELYFVLVAAARQRGYPVLTFEGPGQGSALREQGLTFTHEWEKPTTAVLDAFLGRHPRPSRIVLVGMSMGGFLAPRAAAFDPRFDGVVAYDVMYDVGETARRYVPPLAIWLHDHGLDFVLSAVVRLKSALNPDFRWAYANGQWVMGTQGPIETLRAFDPYVLTDVAGRITGDVLILAGADDHFVPLSQVTAFEQALSAARSVTTRVYDRASGGAEHCQLGAHSLWHQDFFDWVAEKFANR